MLEAATAGSSSHKPVTIPPVQTPHRLIHPQQPALNPAVSEVRHPARSKIHSHLQAQSSKEIGQSSKRIAHILELARKFNCSPRSVLLISDKGRSVLPHCNLMSCQTPTSKERFRYSIGIWISSSGERKLKLLCETAFCGSALTPVLDYTFSRERLRRVLRKKAAVILDLHTFTPADLDLHTFTPADLDLHTFTPADLDLHTFTPADLHLHTFTSADLHLHTFTPADLDLQTFTPADLDLHTFTPADLDLHTLTSADLDLHTFTPADLDLHTLTSVDRGCEDLDLHTLTSADLHLHTLTPADLDLHILTPADLDLHTLTSADLHHHTLTPADLDLHTLTPADLDLHTFTSADLLSLFFYSLLRRGRCRRSATKRNPFARNGRWTSKT